ncbi:Mannan polymerase II complex ANP1 subunit [Ceratocystis lukuohia]|uniref:Mannan polymerase II complex ANP1 subunit n=2 Tax=Ceratocystis TaxID=5157 RepID=A0A2C5X884_9PEZI|nr:Mannan polymerase II complex ANP1 subunit [Ceratocystis fimbriata CBS 114723]
MLLPKDGISWKYAQARVPAGKALLHYISRPRSLLLLGLGCFFIVAWHGVQSSAAEMQRFYCWGPATPPTQMSTNDQASWSSHQQTPVVFNHHAPIEVNQTSIINIDLNAIKSTKQAIANEERILLLTPLKDAGPYLEKYFELIIALTYPHHLIDLGFLISDSTDETLAILATELERVQSSTDKSIPFRSATIVQKDFGFSLSQDVQERHSFEAQGPRRMAMGKARNYLLSATLKADHSWVYWRDVDIVESSKAIIEDFIAHDRDILVPNIWFHRYRDGKDIEGRFDYNSWIESDTGRKLSLSLDRSVVLAEGYKQYKTGRTYMAKMGDWRKDKDEEIELDGIGGVNILVKGDVHRAGINFPAYPFENQAETEGFAKMAKRAGYGVWGLPNYVVWHIDTEEKAGNA